MVVTPLFLLINLIANERGYKMNKLKASILRIFCLVTIIIAIVYGCVFGINAISIMLELNKSPSIERIGSILNITLIGWYLFAGFVVMGLLCFIIAAGLILLYKKHVIRPHVQK